MTHTLVSEPYNSVQVRTGALLTGRLLLRKPHAVCYGSPVTSRKGRETHRHDYTRLPTALSDAVGGLSTALGLFASPPLILSTESVVVMEWKGTSTAIATRAASPERCCS